MKYEEYIKLPNVSGFIDYFSKNMSVLKKSHWVAKENYQFHADNLMEACNNYIWTSSFLSPVNSYGFFKNASIVNSSDWETTKDVLNKLSKGLQKSIAEGSDVDTLDWCRCVLEWGMGSRKEATFKRLRLLSESQKLNLYLKNISINLASDNLNLDEITDSLLIMPNNNDGPWMSSGLSKIISLSTDEIIIMDSRVGAALCELINNYLMGKVNKIPEELIFAWAPSSFNSKLFKSPVNRREPKIIQGVKNHPQFKNKGTSWLIQQIKASWLLKGVIKKNHNKNNNQLHELEAGLFMIGYNLDNTNQNSYRTKAAELRIEKNENTTDSKTIGEENIWNKQSLGTLMMRNIVLDRANYVPTMASVDRAIERRINNEKLKKGDSTLLKSLFLWGNNNGLQMLSELSGRKNYLLKNFTSSEINDYPKHLIATFLYGEFKRRCPDNDDNSLKSWLKADRYTNTKNLEGKGADNLVSAARSFGKYFGLLEDNKPTSFFYSYFQLKNPNL